MTVLDRVGTLVPDSRERRAVRAWLFPWATAPGWWRAPALVAAVLAVFRVLLGLVSHRPWFMNDTGEYLVLVDDLYVPRTRPPGVSVFWRVLLSNWNSLDAILVGQTLLGIAAGVLLFFVAREVGLRALPAFIVAVVASCAPTVVFFERVLMTESLAYFLTVLTLWLVLVAVRTGSPMAWATGGLVAGASVLVRLGAVLAIPIFAVFALVLVRGSILRRLAALVAFAVAALLPLVGYGFASYVDTRAITGTGHFGLQFTDGYAYFAATAPLTDCSRPNRPPAVRAAICAEPDFVDRDPDAIVWQPGPVNDALRSSEFIDYNAQLRELARDNVRDDPFGFVRLALEHGGRLVSTYDNRYYTDGSAQAGPLTALGLPTPMGSDHLGDLWPKALDAWAILRWGLWLALGAALVLAPFRWRRGGRVLYVVVVPAVVSFAWLALTTIPVARYLVMFEPAGWLAAAWLVQTALVERAGPAPELARRIEEPVGVGG